MYRFLNAALHGARPQHAFQRWEKRIFDWTKGLSHGPYWQSLMVQPLRGDQWQIAGAGMLVAIHAVWVTLAPPAARPALSNLAQLALGTFVLVVLFQGWRESSGFVGRIRLLLLLACAAHLAGQMLYAYYDLVLHASLQSPWWSDQLLFFWVVPLVVATVRDPLLGTKGRDWDTVLDFSQVLLLGCAWHLFVFGSPARWALLGSDMSVLEWKVRVGRDVFVLGALLLRTALCEYAETRRIYLGLSLFFFAFALADISYLYLEVVAQVEAGTIMDLGWTLPLLLLVVVVSSWGRRQFDIQLRPRRNYLLLHAASIVVPLVIFAFAAGSGEPSNILKALLLASFSLASFRLLMANLRQERLYRELKENRDLFSAIVEGTSEAMYLKDLEGRYLLVNPAACELLGCDPSEVVGRTDAELFPAEVADGFRESDQTVLFTQKPLAYEPTIQIGDKQKSLLTRKVPYRNAEGEIAGVLGLSVDVTETRRLEEQLRTTQRLELLGTLSAGIAHDFNNLLTVIGGYSEMLMETQAGKESAESLNSIQEASRRATTLVRQLLAFSRKQEVAPQVVKLNEIISGLEKMLRRLIPSNIKLVTELAPDLKRVKVDPGQMEQVLINLAVNARDAMPGGGTLTLSTRMVEGAEPRVCVSVTDTGTGMSPQIKARIFEQFFTTKEEGKGSGLGLATVQRIVKHSGGTIEVFSQPGAGSRFDVYLPATQESSNKVSAEQPELRKRRDCRKETVLLAEDNVEVCRFAASVLEEGGYSVLMANSGQAAVEIAESGRHRIDLLVTDLMMPNPGGLALARRIAELYPMVSVLFISGYSDDDETPPESELLHKPFSATALMEAVQKSLRKLSPGAHFPSRNRTQAAI